LLAFGIARKSPACALVPTSSLIRYVSGPRRHVPKTTNIIRADSSDISDAVGHEWVFRGDIEKLIRHLVLKGCRARRGRALYSDRHGYPWTQITREHTRRSRAAIMPCSPSAIRAMDQMPQA
jgi:hypothetical protein